MKHTLAVTLILVAVFFVSQIVGLAITSQYISQRIVNETTGEVINISYAGLPLDMQRPEVDESQSYLFILGAVLIGTVLVLLLIKFKGFKLWKMWFFLSVALCLTISFYAFTRQIFPATWPSFIPSGLALALAITLATLKIYKPNFIIHNLSEVFIYGGLAAIFVPIMNVYAVVILLILISVYDMIAVWQSKHMVKMAEFQTESKVFAGLSIPYEMPKAEDTVKKKGRKTVIKSAILGGGDIGFPLLFAGVLMKSAGFLKVLIVPVIVAIALFLLLYYAQKDKFYPAMPFITAGCFVGYGILLLL
jgi:presenilin-like A22 family membrane protease